MALITLAVCYMEPVTSLRASNFALDGVAGGIYWTGERRKGQNIPAELKNRWHRDLMA